MDTITYISPEKALTPASVAEKIIAGEQFKHFTDYQIDGNDVFIMFRINAGSITVWGTGYTRQYIGVDLFTAIKTHVLGLTNVKAAKKTAFCDALPVVDDDF